MASTAAWLTFATRLEYRIVIWIVECPENLAPAASGPPH